MSKLFPPPAPNLDELLTTPSREEDAPFSISDRMPSLRNTGDRLKLSQTQGDTERVSTTTPLGVAASADFLWRYRDPMQGRFVTQPLPGELLAAFEKVAQEHINPLSTFGVMPTPRPFGNSSSLLSFLVDHIVRQETPTNQRNSRFAPGSRRSYSLRLPTTLRNFFDVLRPVSINPCSGTRFANVSQMIVFCIYAFMLVEPWRVVPGHSLWRENRAAIKIARRTRPNNDQQDRGETVDSHPNTQPIDGMTHMHVRIDSAFFEELSRAIDTLAPILANHLNYRLTMAGLWITAMAWAAATIDWGSDPLRIKDYPQAGQSIQLDWHQDVPPGLLIKG